MLPLLNCTVMIHGIIYTVLLIFQGVLSVERAIESNSPTERGKLALEEDGIIEKTKEKGCY